MYTGIMLALHHAQLIGIWQVLGLVNTANKFKHDRHN